MTEEEWLAATDAEPLSRFVTEGGTIRKLRLFGASSCRRIWHLLTDERSRRAVEATEQYAEAATDKRARMWLSQANFHAEATQREKWQEGTRHVADSAYCAMCAAVQVSKAPREARHETYLSGVATAAHVNVCEAVSRGENGGAFDMALYNAELLRQAMLLRDIFGNPFRPVALDPAWLTPTIARLAAAVYEERQLPSGLFDNGRLGVLADALEDAGCDNGDILGHLRGGGEHVRGCWVVDLLLGKE